MNDLDLLEILERLRIATKQKSDSAVAKFLGLSHTAPGTWKSRNTIPYDACFKCWKQTGFSMEWLLTGEGKPKEESPEIDKEEFIENYWKTIDAAVLARFIKIIDNDYKEGIERLALSFYEMTTSKSQKDEATELDQRKA